MNTKQLKQALIDKGLTIEATSYKGRYKVINKDLNLWQTVTFSSQTAVKPAYIKVLKQIDNEDFYSNYTLDQFLKLVTL
jgi:hypothetical protein